MKKVTVMLVIDDALFRECLKNILRETGNYFVAVDIPYSSLITDFTRRSPVDVLIISTRKPLICLLTLTRIYNNDPSKMIFVSTEPDIELMKQVFYLGLKGYITKHSSLNDLRNAIDRVSQGERYVCPEINTEKTSILPSVPSDMARLQTLTNREMEIGFMLAQGKTSKDISIELFISMSTVDVHRHNILKKLNVRKTLSIIRYFSGLGPIYAI